MFLPITLEDSTMRTPAVSLLQSAASSRAVINIDFPEETMDKDLIDARALGHQSPPVTLGAEVDEAPHDCDDV